MNRIPLKYSAPQKTQDGRRIASATKIGATAAVVLGSFIFGNTAFAHGYAKDSRADLCAKGINTNCGYVTSNPSDVETSGGFPSAGARDGEIASANGRYPQLDEQSTDRWHKVAMSSGMQQFTWHIPAQHISANYRYHITKPGWNPNVALTRDSFELSPFCYINDGNRLPQQLVHHDCDVPDRQGYHVILALWEVAYTGNTFYSVIDANFNGDDSGSSSSTSSSVSSSTSSVNTSSSSSASSVAGECNVHAWSPAKVYNFEDRVSHNGALWSAKWYSEAQEPGAAEYGPWQNIGQCD